MLGDDVPEVEQRSPKPVHSLLPLCIAGNSSTEAVPAESFPERLARDSASMSSHTIAPSGSGLPLHVHLLLCVTGDLTP